MSNLIARLRMGTQVPEFELRQEAADEIERLRDALEDVDRWLAAFIEAWDKTEPHKGSQAPVALMEAIRQHSTVREALRDE